MIILAIIAYCIATRNVNNYVKNYERKASRKVVNTCVVGNEGWRTVHINYDDGSAIMAFEQTLGGKTSWTYWEG